MIHILPIRFSATRRGFAHRNRFAFRDRVDTTRRAAAAWLSVTTLLAAVVALGGGAAAQAQSVASEGAGFRVNDSDLRFILQQIKISEAHAAEYVGPPRNLSATPLGAGPFQVEATRLPFGLRTVDGRLNNLEQGQSQYGAADILFPRMLPPNFRPAELPFENPAATQPTSFASNGNVTESRVRTASNLIVDQTAGNPVATSAAGCDGAPPLPAECTLGPGDPYFIPNTAPDVGLSAPYNSWFTLFGQFFDHGLDLVNKGKNGTVFMPLKADDPLVLGPDGVAGTADDLPPQQRFMVLSRATNQPGPDGLFGTADDVKEHTNQTSSFVDQSQTYTSHPSHQVFLREYELRDDPTTAAVDPKPVSTGKMLEGRPGGHGGLATWGATKAQAAAMLGIALSDAQPNPDSLNIPLLATDPYGEFVRGPGGYPQFVLTDNTLLEANPNLNGGQPVPVPANAVRIGHAFLDDINRAADPSRAGFDQALLNDHFVAGDGRVNENIGLTAVHHVFHSEHNRLTDHVKDVLLTTNVAFLNEWLDVDVTTMPTSAAGLVWDGERIFQAAKFITEMEYQHLVFEEFGRKVQPQVNIFGAHDTSINTAIVAEFAHTVYRFGHTMLTETVARTNADGTKSDIPLLEAFLNPREFLAGGLSPDEATARIVRGMTRQVGNEIDELVTEALRNRLLGLPLDLASINMARGRETGIPPLNSARRTFFAQTGDSALRPYGSWAEFQLGLRHREAIVNFVAAYGTHPSITGANTLALKREAADLLVHGTDPDAIAFMNSTDAYANVDGKTVTGVDDVDFWVGGLAERQQPFGGLLGNTFNYVFETQLENLQDGDRFYYLTRLAGLNLLTQLEGNSFAELVERNSTTEGLPADAFSRPDFIFNLPSGDDPTTPDFDESTLLSTVGGRRVFDGEEHVVFNGTPGPDKVRSSEGDDTMRGNGDKDVFEGMAGNDNLIGGLDDDILTDEFGDDVIKGGDGDDVLSSGQGFDLNQGGPGSDYIKGGSDPTETLAGPGNDLIIGGASADTVFGDDDDDWIQGGTQADLLQGDLGAPFQDDPNTPGHDVIMGEGGDDDYDSEGGDDIMVGGPGIERNEGMNGFDWVTHKGDPQPANDDMRFTGLLPDTLDTLRDRFDLTEGLSGWDKNDILRGDAGDAGSMVGNELDLDALAPDSRIAGLQALLGGDGTTTTFTGGNILIGGAGSDILEGRGGNDLIDGDAWLNVALDPDGSGPRAPVDNMRDIEPEVLAGTLDPGNIRIVREIVRPASTVADVDTAEFTGPRADYTVDITPTVVTVEHTAGTQADGRDRITNIERLKFSDQMIEVANPDANAAAAGTVTINDTTPTEDQPVTVTAALTDADNATNPVPASAITLTWEMETRPGEWAAVNFAGGPSFTPTDLEVGAALRVVATFTDAKGVLESVVSAPTAAVENVNDATQGAPVLDDPTPQESVPLTATTSSIQDDDGLLGVNFAYQWQQSTNTGGTAATGWTNISIAGNADADNGASFTPTQGQVNRWLRLQVSYTDAHGTAETVTSASSGSVVGDSFVAGGAAFVSTSGDDVVTGGAGAETFSTGAGSDIVNGAGGNDNITTGAGDDIVTGGAGDDTINTGDGNDRVLVTGSAQGFDRVTGGNGTDRIEATSDSTVIGLTTLATTEVITAEIPSANVLTPIYYAPVTVSGSPLADTVSFAGVSLVGIDSISGGAGNDNLTGSDAADVMRGGDGNDTINSGAGNDTVQGDAGDDPVNGGTGDDTFVYSGAAEGFDRVTGGDGVDTMEAAVAGTNIGVNTIATVEAVTGAGLANVRILGSGLREVLNFSTTALDGIAATDGAGANDSLTGSPDADVLMGGVGPDTINGNGGNDTVEGGADADAINVATGDDTVKVSAAFGADTVSSFDGNAAGGQDKVDLSALGVTAANFATRVSEAQGATTTTTVITVRNAANAVEGTVTISGAGPAAIDATDFVLAP